MLRVILWMLTEYSDNEYIVRSNGRDDRINLYRIASVHKALDILRLRA